MGAHHLDPSLVTEPRVKFVSAQQVLMHKGNEFAVAALSKGNLVEEQSSLGVEASSSQRDDDGVITEADGVHVENLSDIAGYQGDLIEMGGVKPHTGGPIAPVGGVSSTTQSDLLGYNFGEPSGSRKGGATRNKRATKKYKSKTYKSKKNKRQSRRKLRRASSRKGRK